LMEVKYSSTLLYCDCSHLQCARMPCPYFSKASIFKSSVLTLRINSFSTFQLYHGWLWFSHILVDWLISTADNNEPGRAVLYGKPLRVNLLSIEPLSIQSISYAKWLCHCQCGW
jgi:hypothetical protein